jgi:hypothetical protein
MGEMTCEELAAMTDPELLAYEREHHGDPYMTLGEAKKNVLASWGGQEEGGPGGPGGGAASPSSEVVSIRLRCCH